MCLGKRQGLQRLMNPGRTEAAPTAVPMCLGKRFPSDEIPICLAQKMRLEKVLRGCVNDTELRCDLLRSRGESVISGPLYRYRYRTSQAGPLYGGDSARARVEPRSLPYSSSEFFRSNLTENVVSVKFDRSESPSKVPCKTPSGLVI